MFSIYKIITNKNFPNCCNKTKTDEHHENNEEDTLAERIRHYRRMALHKRKLQLLGLYPRIYLLENGLVEVFKTDSNQHAIAYGRSFYPQRKTILESVINRVDTESRRKDFKAIFDTKKNPLQNNRSGRKNSSSSEKYSATLEFLMSTLVTPTKQSEIKDAGKASSVPTTVKPTIFDSIETTATTTRSTMQRHSQNLQSLFTVISTPMSVDLKTTTFATERKITIATTAPNEMATEHESRLVNHANNTNETHINEFLDKYSSKITPAKMPTATKTLLTSNINGYLVSNQNEENFTIPVGLNIQTETTTVKNIDSTAMLEQSFPTIGIAVPTSAIKPLIVPTEITFSTESSPDRSMITMRENPADNIQATEQSEGTTTDLILTTDSSSTNGLENTTPDKDVSDVSTSVSVESGTRDTLDVETPVTLSSTANIITSQILEDTDPTSSLENFSTTPAAEMDNTTRRILITATTYKDDSSTASAVTTTSVVGPTTEHSATFYSFDAEFYSSTILANTTDTTTIVPQTESLNFEMASTARGATYYSTESSSLISAIQPNMRIKLENDQKLSDKDNKYDPFDYEALDVNGIQAAR